jgi:hypothetical protein
MKISMHIARVPALICCSIAGMLGASPAPAHDDQIAIVVAQFSGPHDIGLGVANVLKLKLQARSRSADPGREQLGEPPFGGGYYQVSKLPVQPPQHDAAEHRARINGAQMTLWGSIASVGELVVLKGYISIPEPYHDFRTTANEIWRETLGDVTLSVDVPRRRIDFNLQSLPAAVVDYYARDLQQMRICTTKAMQDCPDRVAEGVRFLVLEGDLARVRYPTDRFGYIRIPDIVSSAHPDIVDYASGLIALFRADWEGADGYFGDLARSETGGARTQSDALLLQAMARAKAGLDGAEQPAAEALALNRFDDTALRYLVMAKLNAAASGDPIRRQRKLLEIGALVEEHAALLNVSSAWGQELLRLLRDF